MTIDQLGVLNLLLIKTLLVEMKSTSNNYPKRTIKARGSSETKKYLGHLWEGPSSKVFVKIFVCLFTY